MTKPSRIKKKILLVSTFPPRRCGIGTYAQEQLAFLKSQGHIVYTGSFEFDCAANFRFGLGGFLHSLRSTFVLVGNSFDTIHCHYEDGFFFPPSKGSLFRKALLKIFQLLFFFSLKIFGSGDIVLTIHEISTGSNVAPSFRWVRALAFLCVSKIELHTETEKENFTRYFGRLVNEKKLDIVKHERFMQKKYFGSKEEACLSLGVNQSQTNFLCIGFWQEHKAYDLAITAIDEVKHKDKHLYVVGSRRVNNADDIDAYRDRLLKMGEISSFTTVKEQFVSDEDFDKWLCAVDYLILPYNEIWSSGVGARAQLYGTKLVLRAHPNLVSQFGPNNLIFKDLPELTSLISDAHKPVKLAATKGEAKQFKKLLFVMAWFGKNISGGAEKVVYETCEKLASEGLEIEVWATKSSSIDIRNNDVTDDTGVPFPVRRFDTNISTEPFFSWSHAKLNQGKAGRLARYVWRASNLTGLGMEDALELEKDEFDAVVLCHYLSGSSHRLSGICPEKTIIWPFIHNEPPLFSPVMRELFAGTRGAIVNTEAEVTLGSMAQCGLPPLFYQVIGNAVVQTTFSENPVQSPQNYLLYIGRLIAEKNLNTLLDWHFDLVAKDSSAPDLYLMGDGPLKNDPRLQSSNKVKLLGRVSSEEKTKYLQNAIALVQPSLLESFSIVLMEAWLEQIPVIVHEGCLATYSHILRSSGGFAVKDVKGYEAAIHDIKKPGNWKTLGGNGHRYVSSNYNWETVINNFKLALRRLIN